jgi:hypothetical protein
LNSSVGLPRYLQVKLALEREIAEGPFAPGDLLPSERLLCERFGVSNATGALVVSSAHAARARFANAPKAISTRCGDWNIPITDEWLRFGATTFEDSGYAETVALLELRSPHTALLVAADLMIQGVYQAARDRHGRIPRQLAIVGFDEAGFAERYDPPLTALSTTEHDIGRASARLLLQILSGECTPPTEVILEPALIVGSSWTEKRRLLMEVPIRTAGRVADRRGTLRLRNRT